jgi:endoglucanase
MKRLIGGAVLVVLALLGVNLHRWSGLGAPAPRVAAARPVTRLPAAGPAWGVYDPGQRFAGAPGVTVEQIYRPWNPEQHRALMDDVRAVRARGRVPLVGLEPWPFVWAGMAEEALLADVVAGRYDGPIRAACAALAAEAPQPVLVRWGHEMDLVGRFPWSTDDPQAFVGAYRRFVGVCRSTGATNLAFVWSPGGGARLQEYWPGAAYVDYVGATGLGFGEWDVWRGAARPNTFREIFGPRYELLRGYGKPVLLCEFATTGPAAYQERWLAEAGRSFGDYPLLMGVVYFNAVDPVAWGEIGVPDWRVSPALFPPRAAAPAAAP